MKRFIEGFALPFVVGAMAMLFGLWPPSRAEAIRPAATRQMVILDDSGAPALVGTAVGMPIRGARPGAGTQFKQRTVTEAATTDLCDLSGALECNVSNLTDVDMCVKVTTSDATCGSTTITCASDTDIIRIPSGATFGYVLASGETLCGRMVSAPTGTVHSIEVMP